MKANFVSKKRTQNHNETFLFVKIPLLQLFGQKNRTAILYQNCGSYLVGITGFEPAASSSRTKRATKLRYIPIIPFILFYEWIIIKFYWVYCVSKEDYQTEPHPDIFIFEIIECTAYPSMCTKLRCITIWIFNLCT